MLVSSTYSNPKVLFNTHAETIYPALFRTVNNVHTNRERIHTPDGDFLDLDWSLAGSNKLVIISHGLEGNSQKAYVLGMIKAVNSLNRDALAWNFRGCSGEMNLKDRFYHSGATEDLETVITHAFKKGYQQVQLIGFSLGGNLTLKYLGEDRGNKIESAVVFSVPMDLEASSYKLMKWFNYFYSKRFLNSLVKKVMEKMPALPSSPSLKEINGLRSVFQFDDLITAPLHGFNNAKHYYKECSSLFFLPEIKTPTLIVNAQNDPFLSESCFPFNQLKNHRFVYFASPLKGGHCGFADFSNPFYWSEQQVVEFLE